MGFPSILIIHVHPYVMDFLANNGRKFKKNFFYGYPALKLLFYSKVFNI